MLEKEFENLYKAYEEYNLDEREEVSLKILIYIKDRILENKEELQSLSEILSDIPYEEIIKIFSKEAFKTEEYKKEKVFKKLEDGFMYGTYTTSVGNVAVECEKTEDVLRYFIYAIQSRNTITISDLEFKENDLKHAILLIFTEALEKFNINKNLINIMPYEECYYDNFDVVIDLEENKTRKRKEVSKLFIYKTSNIFDEEVKKEIEYLNKYNREYELISGNLLEATKKINEVIASGASIYTDNPKDGYRFINLVHSKNVFVNTSFAELDEKIQDSKNALYMKKKIMYPSVKW